MITNKRTTFYVSLLFFIFIILYAGSSVEANSGGKYNSSNSCGSCHGSSSSSVTPTYSGFPCARKTLVIFSISFSET